MALARLTEPFGIRVFRSTHPVTRLVDAGFAKIAEQNFVLIGGGRLVAYDAGFVLDDRLQALLVLG